MTISFWLVDIMAAEVHAEFQYDWYKATTNRAGIEIITFDSRTFSTLKSRQTDHNVAYNILYPFPWMIILIQISLKFIPSGESKLSQQRLSKGLAPKQQTIILANYDPQTHVRVIRHQLVNTVRPRQNGRQILTTVSNAFSWMKMYKFRLRFHWSLFPGIQLTIFPHCFG